VYVDDGGLVLSPTDLTKHLECPHVTTLDLAVARHQLAAPELTDDPLNLIFRLGREHEADYLESLRGRGLSVAEIPDTDDLESRVTLTVEAMRRGVDVIYQATFLHDGRRGHADFLLRAERRSDLGDYAYDVADTKLARRLKVAALVQMADYGRHLERLQGCPPEWLTVVAGDGQELAFRYADAAAYARRATDRLARAIADGTPTRAQPVAHCAQCHWAPRCEAEWAAEDNLSLVAFMRADHRHALEAAGVRTVAALAAADPARLPAGIGPASRVRLQAQAALQVRERATGVPCYALLDPVDRLGLLKLPEPSPGDVFLDFEGDPYAEGMEGREYLAGLWDRHGAYTCWWAHTRDEERALTEALLTDLVARLDADPGMHVYHYAPYERSALARLTQRHAVAEAEFDRLLRGERLVDLYAVVRQGLRISKDSYSLKKLEAFYWGESRNARGGAEVADAMASVVAYERWLVTPDPEILPSIETYNREDVRSTHDLRDWLEECRAELEQVHGPRPRPTPGDGSPPASLSQAQAAEAAIIDRLLAAGHPLLAGLVGYHRREAKPQWWEFYRGADLTDQELIADGASIGELGAPVSRGPLPRPATSTVWRYAFPPQETKIGAAASDVDTHHAFGEILRIDPTEGWLDLKVRTGKLPPRPRGLGPPKPFGLDEQQKSLQRTAAEVLAGQRPMGQLVLERVVPPNLAAHPGESADQVAVRVARTLNGAVLTVQGPPGSGKTTTGAAIIRALLDDGLRVGVTARSHAVIGKLLTDVGRPALQKCDADDHCGAPGVDRADTNPEVVAAFDGDTHRLFGGTAWLWAREDMTARVDVLVVDEAGQASLADTVAVARAARRGLVLLGDPQQLAHPSQGQHPDGAGVSALEYLLEGHATIPPDRGVFLDRTWRLAPALAEVVSGLMYDGRLQPAPGNDRQRLVGPDPWAGSGVRWHPVRHAGNEAASSEEAAAVAELVATLRRCTWVDRDGVQRPVGLADVLVVAPYNAHVGRLRAALPAGARIGTVDKFQGQEAPVVIYSMASSSAADAPRGVTFLYDLHRLNVAISRARCLAIVVASPALLDAPVRDPGQLRAVNGLITVAEAG
jgi:uncharacterized protein